MFPKKKILSLLYCTFAPQTHYTIFLYRKLMESSKPNNTKTKTGPNKTTSDLRFTLKHELLKKKTKRDQLKVK